MDYDHVKKQLGYGIQTESKDNAIKAIEQLTARISELEEENARLKETLVDHGEIQKSLCENLSASQAYAEQLVEALLTCQKRQIIYECRPTQNYKTYDSDLVAKALALPRDTSALDAYVANKLKEATK